MDGPAAWTGVGMGDGGGTWTRGGGFRGRDAWGFYLGFGCLWWLCRGIFSHRPRHTSKYRSPDLLTACYRDRGEHADVHLHPLTCRRCPATRAWHPPFLYQHLAKHQVESITCLGMNPWDVVPAAVKSIVHCAGPCAPPKDGSHCCFSHWSRSSRSSRSRLRCVPLFPEPAHGETTTEGKTLLIYMAS